MSEGLAGIWFLLALAAVAGLWAIAIELRKVADRLNEIAARDRVRD